MDHDELSFGIAAPTPGRLALPTEQEVFAYLDENPDALQRYLRGEMPIDALGSVPIPHAAALENEGQDLDGWLVDFGDLLAGVDFTAESELETEQAVDMWFDKWEQLDKILAAEVAFGNEMLHQAGPDVRFVGIGSLASDDEESEEEDDDGEESVASADEEASQAGLEMPSEENDATSVDEESAEEETDEDEYVEVASNDAEDSGADEPAPVDNNVRPTSTPPAASGGVVDSGLIPYPAPAEMIAESRAARATRRWALWEEDACIRHMLAINSEKRLKGESRFREALRRMQQHDGCKRNKPNAVKNFWNRVGRARSLLDERRNKRAPLATSKQGKKAKDRTTTSTTPSRSKKARTKTSCSSAKPRKGKSVRQPANLRKPSKAKRRQKNEETSEEEEAEFSIEGEEESGYPAVDSDNEEPHLGRIRKRKDFDDCDGDQDAYTPDSAEVNAAAKGLRPPKRARTAAAY